MQKTSNYKLFFIIVFLHAINLFFIRNFIFTDDKFFDFYKDQMSFSRIEMFLDLKEKMAWVNYLMLFAFYLFKFSLISLWLLCATILLGYKVSFNRIIHAVIQAEFIWLIPSIITIVWFGFIDTDYTIIEIQYFKPLSLLSLFDPFEVDSWLIFPLRSLNLFEIIYLFVLAFCLKKILNQEYNSSLSFTVSAYGTALITWIVFITFLSINLTA